tara:strand:+ start:1248 stop:1472 length:225 start_codon:yes stop_codon:yes gene_type:complete
MKWIRCSKYLPLTKKEVLILMSNRKIGTAKLHKNKGLDLALYGEYCWYATHNDYEAFSAGEVTHWMILPRRPCK